MTIDPGRQQSATLRHLHTAAKLHRLAEPPDKLSRALDELTAQLHGAAPAEASDNSFDPAILSTIDRIATTATFGDLLQRRTLGHLATAAAALLLATPAAFAQPRNPFEYNSLGELNVVNDSWTFDTTTGQARHGAWPGTDYVNGELRDGAAVFCFDSISVASGSSLVVQGTRPLVLLSRNAISIRGTVSANGWPGFDANNLASGTAFIGFGTGGSGIGGAPAVFTHFGAPPLGVIVGGRGGGPGGGFGGTDRDLAQGGSFGGVGASFHGSGPNTYGNLLRHLEGGSGGGGAMTPAGSSLFGAGGGGAIEIGSFQNIEITGEITALGGDTYGTGTAGAGSGGGILIHADTVSFRLGGNINVAGGLSPAGSHGGGGRVTVQSRNPVSLSRMSAPPGGVGAESGVIANVRHNFDMPTVYEFGNVPLGSSKPIAVRFSSEGDVDTVMNAYFEDTAPDSPFTRYGSGIASGVRPGQTGAVVYYFTPPSPGPFSDMLTVHTNAGPVTVTLTGTGGDLCGDADFNGDGDFGTDADIEAFFRVLAGGNC